MARRRRRPSRTMNNLANDLALLGRFEEAAPLMQRTLEIKVELYGADHPSTLNSVSNLAELDDQRGRDVEAEALHRQVLDARTRVLGSDHSRTLETMERLAANLSNQGRHRGGGTPRRDRGRPECQEPRRASRDHAGCPGHARARAGRAAAARWKRRRSCGASWRSSRSRSSEAKTRGKATLLADVVRVHLGMALADAGPARRSGGPAARSRSQAAAPGGRHASRHAVSRPPLRGLEPRAARPRARHPCGRVASPPGGLHGRRRRDTITFSILYHLAHEPLAPAVSRLVTALTATTAAALVLRLAGVFREFLPSAGRLAALLAVLHLLSIARRRGLDEWRLFVRAHAFGIGLFAVCVLAVAVRIPGFASDLGHTPLDIDEWRLAANVRQYLVTGKFEHDHIEQYPGAVFWLFVGSSSAWVPSRAVQRHHRRSAD